MSVHYGTTRFLLALVADFLNLLLLYMACDITTRRANHQKPVHPSAKKIPPSAVGQITATSSPRPDPTRGALAIVTKRGAGCGGRGCAFDERHGGGRRSRVVLSSSTFSPVKDQIKRIEANGLGGPGGQRKSPADQAGPQ
jgi:hypothetical protein